MSPVRPAIVHPVLLAVWAWFAVAATSARAEPPPEVQTQRASYVHLSAGYATGVDVNRHIQKRELRLGYEQVFHEALSGGPELALVVFRGSRAGRSADTLGVTALYQLKWHALRYRGYAWQLGFGFGAAYFFEPFPPGGTRLNGYSFFGTGFVLPLGARVLLLLEVREMHHSNGRGLVTSNPAFDGVSFHVGLGVRP